MVIRKLTLVVIMPYLQACMKSLRSLILVSREMSSSRFFSLKGSAGLLPVSALENPCCPDILYDCVEKLVFLADWGIERIGAVSGL